MDQLDDFFIIDAIEATADGYSGHVRLNSDHVIFRAHFPEDPITPGACLVRMAGKVLAACLGRAMMLKRVVSVKFIHVVRPTEVESLTLSYTHLHIDDDGCAVRLVITDENNVYAKMSLFFTDTSIVK